jgi:hypothetical protein
MAYDQDDDINDDIISRKEFYWLKKEISELDMFPRYMLEKDIRTRTLIPTGYQLFAANFMNPHTDFKRLFLNWRTGTGKSIGSLWPALNFIAVYRIMSEAGLSEIGSIFVIGFSEKVFKNELLRFPEFGFISEKEKKRLERLRNIAFSGSQREKERYKDFLTKIKKRFSNRKNNGFFKFFGFKAFVNRIFKTDLDIHTLSAEEITKSIENGEIKFNEELLAQFKNSLIIADEIHNVYNSLEKNNWGVAIQAVLDREPTCRAIFASATPLNNSPTEIVDLLNLLLPPEKKLVKSELFKDKKLKPKALSILKKAAEGRISYLRDVDPATYPSMHFMGEPVKNIKYLKFIRVPMSKFQASTYKKMYNGSIPQDSSAIVDIVLPDPEKKTLENGSGLYKLADIQTKYLYASKARKDSIGFDYIDQKIVGTALEKKYLATFSAKYAKMLDIISDIISNKGGKTFIFHNNVHLSGVMLIEKILLANGIIDEYGAPGDNTICFHCGKTKKSHPTFGSAEQKNPLFGAAADLENVTTDENTLTLHSDGDFSRKLLSVHLHPNIPNKFFVRASDLDIDIVEGVTYAIQEFNRVIFALPGDVDIEAPITPQLTNWLLHSGAKLQNTRISNGKEKAYFTLKNGGGENLPAAEDQFLGAKDKQKTKDHEFTPVRYAIVHSEIDKSKIDQSLERFNGIGNADGNKILFLVGSKIMKESYDTKGVRNVLVMSRPVNISTLVQIIGRAVRKNSHQYLPKEEWNVSVYLVISVLADGSESYEENRYAKKMQDYETIQEIEKVLHESAVDNYPNYDRNIGDNKASLTFLPYKKASPPSKLNLSTFVHYAKDEIDYLKIAVKRSFLEISSVWDYKSLKKFVKEDHFKFVNVNLRLASDEAFAAAVTQLAWDTDEQYATPIIQNSSDFIRRLMDPEDKIIIFPDGKKAVIIPMINCGKQWLVLCFLVNGRPKIDIEAPFRSFHEKTHQIININQFMRTKNVNFDYREKRQLFFDKYNAMSLEYMENAVCEYGPSFHIKFIEECIEYVFNAWTSPHVELDEWHDFYFKMLYYYDLLSLIMWAYTTKARLFKRYEKYAVQVKSTDIKLKTLHRYERRETEIKKQEKKRGRKRKHPKYEKHLMESVKGEDEDVKIDATSELASSGIINLLKTSFNNTSNVWIPKEFRQEFAKTLKESRDLFAGRRKRIKRIVKVSAKLLPIGHFITKFPRIYHPESGWTEDPLYIQHDRKYKENDLLIGYDMKSRTGVHVRFKIRSPIHAIKKYKDTRLIEKGTVCKSKLKPELLSIAKKIGVILPDKMNVDELCELIRAKLIRMELKERIKGSDVKYFYFHYENQLPE